MNILLWPFHHAPTLLEHGTIGFAGGGTISYIDRCGSKHWGLKPGVLTGFFSSDYSAYNDFSVITLFKLCPFRIIIAKFYCIWFTRKNTITRLKIHTGNFSFFLTYFLLALPLPDISIIWRSSQHLLGQNSPESDRLAENQIGSNPISISFIKNSCTSNTYT